MMIRPTVKGQIVIPVALRRKYGITEKTQIHVYEEDGKIILQPITREFIRSVRGILKNAPIAESIAEMRTEDEREEEESIQQWLKTASSTPRR